MGRYERQFAAAAQYDNASPDYDERDPSDAIAMLADKMVSRGDVGDLLDDLYDNGYAYGALDRLMCGRPAMFGDTDCLQKLRRRLLALNEDVEREMQS